MHFNQFDDLIKKAMLETERSIEPVALQAKESVWQAIDKPKRKRDVSWGFVTAIAASIVLFLISSILFIKLEDQKKDLIALHATVKSDLEESGKRQLLAEKTEEAEDAKNIPSDKSNLEIQPTAKRPTTPKLMPQSKIESIASEPFTASAIEILPEKPDMTLAEFPLKNLKPEMILISERKEEKPAVSKSKATKKLRIQIGNNSKVYHSENTLALNIKLSN